MIKMLLATSVFAVSAMAHAALPPEYDQAAKFNAILGDAKVVSELGAGLIVAITQVEPLVFAVEFNQYRCTYRVHLNAKVPNHPGPVAYSVAQIEQPTCERP